LGAIVSKNPVIAGMHIKKGTNLAVDPLHRAGRPGQPLGAAAREARQALPTRHLKIATRNLKAMVYLLVGKLGLRLPT
jgi:hypothetical protein